MERQTFGGEARCRRTRASSWRHRASPALAQAQETAATGDVLVFSHPAVAGGGISADALNLALPIEAGVRVLAAETLHDATLHAEADATQLTAHYLLPLEWLDGGAEAAAWAAEHARAPAPSTRAGRSSVAVGPEVAQQHSARAERPPPPPAITRLKRALRAASDATPCRPSPGRYGRLSENGKACWSAFSEPVSLTLARRASSQTSTSLSVFPPPSPLPSPTSHSKASRAPTTLLYGVRSTVRASVRSCGAASRGAKPTTP